MNNSLFVVDSQTLSGIRVRVDPDDAEMPVDLHLSDASGRNFATVYFSAAQARELRDKMDKALVECETLRIQHAARQRDGEPGRDLDDERKPFGAGDAARCDARDRAEQSGSRRS